MTAGAPAGTRGPPRLAGLRRYAGTIALVIAAATAGAILLIDRDSVSTSESERRKRNLLEAWRPDDLTEVVVASHGETARLARSEPNEVGQRPWRVTIEGREHEAEEQVVDQLLGTLELATFERRVPPESVDRMGFGLEAPSGTLVVSMGGRRARVSLGGPAPTPAGAIYAEVEGRGVFVITRELGGALAPRVESFRSRSLVPYFSVDVRAIRIEGRGGTRHFVRAPWGGSRGAGFRWGGTTPEGDVRVDATALDRLLAALGRMEAQAFLTDEAADRALERQVTLTLVPKDTGAEHGVLEVGGACPGREGLVVAVRRKPARASVCVSKPALEALAAPAAQFVDLRLVGAHADEITEVKLESGADRVEIARSASGFRMRSPADRMVDADAGRAFMEALLRAEAERFATGEPGEVGLSPPRATARIVSAIPAFGGEADGGVVERVERLEIGAAKGGVVRVRRVEDGAVALVSAEAARVLFPDPGALRSRKLLDEPIEAFRALRVRTREAVQKLERTDTGGWKLLEPASLGADADAGLAADLATAFGSLSVERWVNEKEDASHGLEKPRIVVEADLSSGAGPDAQPKTLRLSIGAAAEGGAYARLGGEDAIFVVPRAFEASASRLLLDRSALVIDPSAVVRVTLKAEAAKAPLVVERSTGGWRVAGASDDPRSSARAASVRDAVEGLVPEGAVSLGAPTKPQGFARPTLTISVDAVPRDAAPGGKETDRRTWVVGAGDAWRGTNIYYLRRDGVDATYVIAQSKIRPLLDAAFAR